MSESVARTYPTSTSCGSASIYTKPSLPYLLSQYGFEDREANVLRQKKEERKKQERLLRKQARDVKSFDSSETEKEIEKVKEQEEHYEQMVKDLYKLRDYYYREYSGMLAEKVQKQRKEQKDRDAAAQKKKEKEMEEALRERHHVKKRLARHTLATTPATESTPKTDLYHIVGLEEKMRREGKLKTMTDYNKFREDMSDPRIFNAFFNKTQGLETKSIASSDYASSHRDGSHSFSLAPDSEADQVNADPLTRSLSRISEGREASRPGTRADNWAVTQQYPSLYKSRGSVANVSKQRDLEKRFPKLEMPKLHCFTMNLAKSPPDPEEVQQQLELRTREKQRKQAVRACTKMYQLAMSNAAASARILDQHEDMDLIHGADLCDVIADKHWMEAYGMHGMFTETDMYEEEKEELGDEGTHEASNLQETFFSKGEKADNEMLSYNDQQDPAQYVPSQEDDRPTTSAKQGSANVKKTTTSVKTLSPLPLTLDEIQQDCNIKESKSLSTFWTNYLHAGKPIGT